MNSTHYANPSALASNLEDARRSSAPSFPEDYEREEAAKEAALNAADDYCSLADD